MRRGEEAISPPPEFQDSPSLPPPVLFRDLSPSNPASSTHAPHQTLTKAVKKCIKEFADKISFNILNEAMLIATLIPAASSINDVRSQSSTPSFPINSDTYSSNSTGTSWEYLEKSNSLSDLRYLQNHLPVLNLVENNNNSRRKSYGQQEYRKTKNSHHRLKKSNSDALSSSLSSKHKITTGMNSGAKLVYCKTATNHNNDDATSKDSSCRATSSKTQTDNDLDLCYNVPFQCDIYSLPVDSIKPQQPPSSSSNRRSQLKRVSKCVNDENKHTRSISLHDDILTTTTTRTNQTKEKSEGVNSSSSHVRAKNCPVLKLHDEEIDSVVETTTTTTKKSNPNGRLTERNNNENVTSTKDKMHWNKKRRSRSVDIDDQCLFLNQNSLNQRKLIQSSEAQSSKLSEFSSSKEKKTFGHTILNLFRRNRPQLKTVQLSSNNDSKIVGEREIVCRALPLPPLPDCVEQPTTDTPDQPESQSPLEPRDFAASIEKVKDCGWYWGPLGSEKAEELLRAEPDGSFIVRDSSDAHYIFSLTFKLTGLVRHVRIEHDQGNFSFGPLTRFKAATIVEFVEKAVAHSRSGRYLFFLHRRPVLGPMQVQLLHPYSRFRHPRSLKHMCRFVILKYVRRDLLNKLQWLQDGHILPLPLPLQNYLNTEHYIY